MSAAQFNQTVSTTIGRRFDGSTVSHSVSLPLDAITDGETHNEVINTLLAKGLYAVLAEMTNKESPASRAEFEALASTYTVSKIAEFITREKSRGAKRSDYPQADRFLDAKELQNYQRQQLMLNKFIPLPCLPTMGLDELVKNKNTGVAKESTFMDVWTSWDSHNKDNTPKNALEAMRRIRAYFESL